MFIPTLQKQNFLIILINFLLFTFPYFDFLFDEKVVIQLGRRKFNRWLTNNGMCVCVFYRQIHIHMCVYVLFFERTVNIIFNVHTLASPRRFANFVSFHAQSIAAATSPPTSTLQFESLNLFVSAHNSRAPFSKSTNEVLWTGIKLSILTGSPLLFLSSSLFFLSDWNYSDEWIFRQI